MDETDRLLVIEVDPATGEAEVVPAETHALETRDWTEPPVPLSPLRREMFDRLRAKLIRRGLTPQDAWYEAAARAAKGHGGPTLH